MSFVTKVSGKSVTLAFMPLMNPSLTILVLSMTLGNCVGLDSDVLEH